MRRLSRNNNLRLGIIFVVTGIIALAHWAFMNNERISPHADLIIGVVLVVLGLPFLVVAVRYGSGTGGTSNPRA